MYNYLVSKSGVAENIKFKDSEKFFSSNLSHLCDSTGEMLHGVVKENITQADDLAKYFSKAKKLVNVKSLAGLGVIIPLAIAAQPINRWITHKMSGKKGAPIYNDDQERILTPEEKKKLTAQKFVAVPLMWAVAGLSMLMDKPSLKMFQFKTYSLQWIRQELSLQQLSQVDLPQQKTPNELKRKYNKRYRNILKLLFPRRLCSKKELQHI